MADVAQLVRALVCGTRCRQFESDHPPHFMKDALIRHLFLLHKTISLVLLCAKEIADEKNRINGSNE